MNAGYSLETFAHVAQLVEHTLGKGEVGSSNLLMSSIKIGGACSIKLRAVTFYLKISGQLLFMYMFWSFNALARAKIVFKFFQH